MSKQENISKYITEELNSAELREKYLGIINQRIDENRKAINGISMILILTIFSFPLIQETKITEISIGPFKLNDNSFAISIIPSIFALCYYKYVTIWIDLVEQKSVYKILTSKIFLLKEKSYLNDRIKHYSFLDSILYLHFEEKSKILGCFVSLIWIPILLGFMFFPFYFEYYTVKTLYLKFGLKNIFDWTFFMTPILIGVFTILMFIQAGKKDLERFKEQSK